MIDTLSEIGEEKMGPVDTAYPPIKMELKDYAGRPIPSPPNIRRAMMAYEFIKSEWKRRLTAEDQSNQSAAEIYLESRHNQTESVGTYIIVDFGDNGDGRNDPNMKLRTLEAILTDPTRRGEIDKYMNEITIKKDMKEKK